MIIKLHNKVISGDIFSLNIRESSTLVISVIIKLRNIIIFKDIFGLVMLEIQFLGE